MRAAPLLFVLAGCTPTESTDHAVVGGNVLAVRVEIDAGNVTVASGGDAVHVERILRGAAIETISQRVEDGILRIEARCATLLPCSADISLVVPAGIPVDVRTGEGDVHVADIDSDLSIQVGDGNVRAERLSAATVRVQAGWGNARLSFLVVPSEVSVGVGVGDVLLSVPYGGYELDVASLTEPTVEVRAKEGGPRLRVHTAAGEATIARS